MHRHGEPLQSAEKKLKTPRHALCAQQQQTFFRANSKREPRTRTGHAECRGEPRAERTTWLGGAPMGEHGALVGTVSRI
jgi:hypothetical protein